MSKPICINVHSVGTIHDDTNVICPYCEAEQFDSSDWAYQNQFETECECGYCEKTFLYYCEPSITCISYPMPEEKKAAA